MCRLADQQATMVTWLMLLTDYHGNMEALVSYHDNTQAFAVYHGNLVDIADWLPWHQYAVTDRLQWQYAVASTGYRGNKHLCLHCHISF